MLTEVEIEGVGSVIICMNDQRLNGVLDAVMHVIQRAYQANEEGQTNVSDNIWSIFESYWRLVYYSARPMTKISDANYFQEFKIHPVGVIILDTSDQAFHLAMEGIFQPLVEAYRKGTQKVALEILNKLQIEGRETLVQSRVWKP